MTTSQPRRLAQLTMWAALLLLPVAGEANAQQPSQAQANAIRQSCRSDYMSYCSSVPTGGSASLQCLQNNMASLSPGCRAAVGGTAGGTPSGAPPATAAPPPPAPSASAPPMAPPPPMTMRQEMMLMRETCGPDYRRLCPGAGIGGGRAVACLADHRESLSPGCREALTAARGPR